MRNDERGTSRQAASSMPAWHKTMSAMSGANGMVYMEYSTGKYELLGQGQNESEPKDPSKRH